MQNIKKKCRILNHLFVAFVGEKEMDMVEQVQWMVNDVHVCSNNFTFQNMEIINQDLLQIEKNMKSIVKQAGPLESQLNVLLQTLPKQNLNLPMETE